MKGSPSKKEVEWLFLGDRLEQGGKTQEKSSFRMFYFLLQMGRHSIQQLKGGLSKFKSERKNKMILTCPNVCNKWGQECLFASVHVSHVICFNISPKF